MRSDHYTLTDDEGGHVTVSPWPRGDQANGDGATLSWRHDRGGVFVAPEKLAEFTAALFEAAGRTAPILLDRPEIIPTCLVPCPDGLVEAVDGTVVFVPHTASPVILRNPAALAAALAVVADHMAREPDPDEVAHVLDAVPADVPPDVARKVVASVLRRFTVEERATGTDGVSNAS